MISLRLQIKIAPDTRIGAGKIRLLEEVERSGSISAATRVLGMTYRRGWELIDHMNKAFGQPVVSGKTGSRGGAELTDLGRDLIARFRAIEAAVTQTAAPHLEVLDQRVVVATDAGSADAQAAGADAPAQPRTRD
jgi:molybdate transport system regulatory protein